MFSDVTPLNIHVSGFRPSMGMFDSETIDESTSDHFYPYVEHAFSHYEDVLVNSAKVWDWFRQRKIELSHPLISQFRLGFADRTLCKHFTRDKGRQSDVVRGAWQQLGILKPSGHQYFHGDVVVPFFDTEHRIAGAYGRRISHEYRQKHIYYHHWFYKDQVTFFNRQALEEYNRIILCKSPIEALVLISAGISNVIATMGLYSFGHLHLEELECYRPSEVILAFDNTDTGNHVSGMIAQALSASNIVCSRFPLPRNQDVGDLAQSHENSHEILTGCIDQVTPFSQSYENLVRRS